MAAPPPPSGHSGTPGTGTDSGQGLSGWTAARIVSVVIGAVLVLISLGLLGAGGTALWAETTQRDAGGYLDLGTATYSTTGYALASDTIDLHAAGNGWDAAKSLFGTVRIRATSADSAIPVFVGIAATDAASRYLTGVQYATVRRCRSWRHVHPARRGGPGDAPGDCPVLDRACGRDQHPDAYLAGHEWRLDGGRDERRRITPSARPRERRCHAAVTAVGRRRPANGRGDLPGRRCRPDRGSVAPRVAGHQPAGAPDAAVPLASA